MKGRVSSLYEDIQHWILFPVPLIQKFKLCELRFRKAKPPKMVICRLAFNKEKKFLSSENFIDLKGILRNLDMDI